MDFEAMRKRIKDRRKFLGMTQEELASKTNLSVMSIRRYENGDRLPKHEIVERIANALQCDISDIISTKEEKDLIIQNVIDSLEGIQDKRENKQREAESAIDGDYLVYISNVLIEHADLLCMLQQAGYRIKITSRTGVEVQMPPVGPVQGTQLMTTSDLVERISQLSKTTEGLINSFPTMAKEADDNAPQDNP